MKTLIEHEPEDPSAALGEFFVFGMEDRLLITCDGVIYVVIPNVAFCAIVSEDAATSFNQALRYVEELLNGIERGTYQLCHMSMQMHYGWGDDLDPEDTGALKDFLPDNIKDYLDKDKSYIVLVSEKWHM